jgi:hypothetical protein
MDETCSWTDGLSDDEFMAECKRRGVLYTFDVFGPRLATDQEIALCMAEREGNAPPPGEPA